MKVLITGGCGFLGSNLAKHFYDAGADVVLVDDLSRNGSMLNREWLMSTREWERMALHRISVLNPDEVRELIREEQPDFIFHMAGQTAVTTSLENPCNDFLVNAQGTFTVLEAVRKYSPNTAVVFASTNKVYGALDDLEVWKNDRRCAFAPPFTFGIDEQRPLDFESPYGCSKGAADQYVRDYARTYGLKTVVLRLSCQYGPRQFGCEDQGWLAHFVIASLLGEKITIFGDGRQVRDVLFVDDLMRVFDAIVRRIDDVAGEVFNIGGGPEEDFSWSLLELVHALDKVTGEKTMVEFLQPRLGDQQIYLSDISKASAMLSWEPTISRGDGLNQFAHWAADNLSMIRSVFSGVDSA